jgi:uncharacterized protein (TIGR03437 family)
VGVAQLVRILIVDNCGNPVAAGGGAQVTFINASGVNPSGATDAPLTLADSGGGVWEGTWIPVNTGAAISLTAIATETGPSGSLQPATAAITVSVGAASAGAAPQPGGVVNSASAAQATPGTVTPGAYIAIYGSALATGNASPAFIPLPTLLNGTQLLLGNEPMPLSYISAGQVNALVPQDLNPNASYQLVVVRGTTRSVPIPVTVAQYEPGIFTVDDSGSGQGAVEIAGTALLAAPQGNGSRPAQSGSDFISVYATGFGPLAGPNGEAPPADGAAAPMSPLFQTTGVVTATIGGVNAPVVFLGLSPTLVALYQINLQVPAGVPTGDAVPLVLTVTDPATGTGYSSNTVTIAVQ